MEGHVEGGNLGWKRPDALRVEWRQNGNDDTDVTRCDARSSE